MSNFDGGHYFLTVLAPIKTGMGEDSGQSYEQLLHATLAKLPTAQQTPIDVESKENSPFARNKRNHFVRFTILSDVTYNGRNPGNAILDGSSNPILFQHIDRLNCAYLLFAVDFDAQTADESELESYLNELWQTVQPELRCIFQNCVGFEDVATAVAFVDYIKRCQIETTMPFNDYWRGAPPYKTFRLGRTFLWLAIAGVAAPWVIDFFAGFGWSTQIKTYASVALVVLAGFMTYLGLVRAGSKPFPTAPDSDLKSILKALYLQRQFTQFAIDNQGATADALYKNFGEFLNAHQPGDVENPTQEPGVISFNQGDES